MKLLWLISVILALTGCVSKRQNLRDVSEAYASGFESGAKVNAPYKIGYDQCVRDLKTIEDKYYRDLGMKLKAQRDARTDK